jgi:hypothetical protein
MMEIIFREVLPPFGLCEELFGTERSLLTAERS